MAPQTLLVPVIATLVALACLSLLAKIIGVYKDAYREQWTADGEPQWFWGFFLRWLFTTPEWARRDSRVKRLLWGFRCLYVLFLFLTVLHVISTMVSAMR